MTIVSDARTINVSLVLALALACVVKMIISDAPNCGITYDDHYDNRNSFIIQATGHFVTIICHSRLRFCQKSFANVNKFTLCDTKIRAALNRFCAIGF